MDDCRHDSWTGITTAFYRYKRCNLCGERSEREGIPITPGGARLPWAREGEEDPHGRDTSPGPDRGEVATP